MGRLDANCALQQPLKSSAVASVVACVREHQGQPGAGVWPILPSLNDAFISAVRQQDDPIGRQQAAAQRFQ